MITTNVLLDLIKASKNNDQKEVSKIVTHLIQTAEKRKQHKLAKGLRELYASTSSNSGEFFQPSSVAQSITPSHKLFEIRSSKISASEIVLSQANKNILDEVISNYKRRDVFEQHGLANDGRVILYGPPGTGKTLFAYVLAGELSIPVFHVYLDSLVSSFLGETGRNLKAIFDEASREECVLLLDEFDAIAKHRDDVQELGELKRVVTVLLQNIDELTSSTLLVAATNHDHLLDPAVWRRFDYALKMDVLDFIARKKLIDLYLKEHGNVDTNMLADLSEGLTGAVIKQVVNRSLRRTLIDDGADLQQLLIEGLLVSAMERGERLKGKRRDNFVKALRYLRGIDSRKYTYEELEKITGMPASTLHHISSNK